MFNKKTLANALDSSPCSKSVILLIIGLKICFKYQKFLSNLNTTFFRSSTGRKNTRLKNIVRQSALDGEVSYARWFCVVLAFVSVRSDE